jgi:DNA-binding cell septation regulator SpoVG
MRGRVPNDPLSLSLFGGPVKISVARYKELNSEGLLGYADLMLDAVGVVIRGCQYRNGSKGTWIAVPSQKYEAQGKTKYAGHVGFPDNEVYIDFQVSAKEAIEEHLGAGLDAPSQDNVPF